MKYCWFLVSLALATPSWAQQWFTVTVPGEGGSDTVVEIDLESVRIHPLGGDGIIRVSLPAAHPHEGGYSYRSFVASAQFDCQKRTVALASAAYYALPRGTGARLGADSTGRDAGMPASLPDLIPGPARQALLKAACSER